MGSPASTLKAMNGRASICAPISGRIRPPVVWFTVASAASSSLIPCSSIRPRQLHGLGLDHVPKFPLGDGEGLAPVRLVGVGEEVGSLCRVRATVSPFDEVDVVLG